MDWKGGYVIVGVGDLDRGIAFYRDALGLPTLRAADF